MKQVEFHPDARAELLEAIAYYDERVSGLGSRFLTEIDATIQRIVEAPSSWRVVEEDVRRCLARRFPYGVLYVVEGDLIQILAVMHCSRKPGYWRSRHPLV